MLQEGLHSGITSSLCLLCADHTQVSMHADTQAVLYCRDVFIQKTPTNFDASVDELWTSLSAGATLVVAPPEAHRDVHSVMTLITRYAVNVDHACAPSPIPLF